MPTADRESLANTEHKAVFDLVAFALAFSFLHEFRHVMYCADKNAPSTLPEEEIACDAWAREFMMSGLDAYSKAHGYNYSDVQQNARQEYPSRR
jgi:hypothetical protein